MKTKYLLLLCLFFFTTIAKTQIKYEKGYFIDNNGNKTECLIYNLDWANNPDYFIYKLTEDGSSNIGTLTNIKEFMVYGYSKYIRSEVNIDLSSSIYEDMDYKRDPIYEARTVFLKVLVEGDATLYSYNSSEMSRFFFKIKDAIIQQLVYKKYKVLDPESFNNSSKVATNSYYQQQLYNEVNCRNLPITTIPIIGYYKKDLEKYFIKDNICGGNPYTIYDQVISNPSDSSIKKIDHFNLRIRPGVNYSKLTVTDDQFDITYDFEDTYNFRFGLELEYVLPFIKNKWSLLLEPNFHYFNSKLKSFSYNPGIFLFDNVYYDLNLNYYSIEIPLGLRFYCYLSNKASIFFDISYVLDFDLNSILRDGDTKLMNVASQTIFAPGAGFEFSKISMEFKYYFKQDLFHHIDDWHSKYNNYTLILGYRF